ncbi:putative wall-associated receptor kinase-like 11 [Diospyros lotus]|uniref:putative wall-associated receptor kinase-like 11 n=1 Tax=Diospyros lotus TaxID=55363 RepID=UPI0022544BEA|nr:putative wall-associated receptor kinase-like 11 [Diospyros lotus]
MSINSKINEHPNANDEHPSEGLCRCFSLAEIRSATNDFDESLVIGKGGFGKVYKGWLAFDISGTTKPTSTVAIKKLNAESKQGAKEFWSEIKALSNLRHPHLVTLYGYCDESNEMILVYDYMSNGTLADHLYKLRKAKDIGTVIPQRLTWERRLNICIGAAQGLAFLHTNTEHTVIHRDVKTSNILLDENWVAKISDFGLSKIATTHGQTHISTDIKGTFGYLDPEYYMTRRLTKKSDVYAFGVVLFEVLSARPAVKAPDEEQGGLATWARDCMKRGALDQIIDPFLKDKVSVRRIKVFAEFAEKCLHNHSNERPTMAEVVESLQLVLASQGNIRQSKAKIKKVPLTSLSRIVAYIVGWRKRIPSFGPNVNGPLNQLQRDRFASIDINLCRCFTMKEIRLATNNFNVHQLLKKIGSIYVYRGVIDRKTEVAIKRLKDVTCRKEFVSEIKLLTKLSSLHIVSLIGYCDERNEAILVYEFMANGSLSDHLYEASGKDPFSWEKRLETCIDAARGLQYLHAGTMHTIVHNGLNPTRILLDKNWVAKVSGFESHEVLHHQQSSITISISGEIEYLAPEYLIHGRSSVKSDAYSFGVILLEVLSGRKPMVFSVDEDQVNLVCWFKINIEKGTINKIIDPRLLDEIAPECLTKYVEIARKCLEEQARERPTMEDVLADLRTVLQLQRRPRNRRVRTVLQLQRRLWKMC